MYSFLGFVVLASAITALVALVTAVIPKYRKPLLRIAKYSSWTLAASFLAMSIVLALSLMTPTTKESTSSRAIQGDVAPATTTPARPWLEIKAQIMAQSVNAATPNEGKRILQPYLSQNDPDVLTLYNRHWANILREILAKGDYQSQTEKEKLLRKLLELSPEDATATRELKAVQKELATQAKRREAISDMNELDLCNHLRGKPPVDEYLAEFLSRGGRRTDMQHVSASRVVPGMTELGAICAWNESYTFDVNRTLHPGRETKQIVFHGPFNDTRFVYVENGIVTAVQD